MKNLILLFTLILAFISFDVHAAKIGDDSLKIGKPGSAADKVFEMGTFQIKKQTGVDAEFSNNSGVLFKKFGSGSGSGGDGGINYLLNAGAEDGVINWTTSGGTFTQETHTNGTESNAKFFRYVSTVAAQYVESDAITISDTNGAGCMFDMKYTQGAGSFDYKVLKSPYADPADVVSTGTVGTLTDFKKAPTQNFACAGGDLLKARITSTAGATIDLDDFYLGSNKGFIPSATVEKMTEHILAGNNATAGDIAGLTFTGLVIGKKYQLSGQFASQSSTSTSNVLRYRSAAGDTGTVYGESRHQNDAATTTHLNWGVNFEFTAVSTELYFYHVSTHVILGDGTKWRTFYQLTEKPESGVEAFTPEQADFFVSANIGGATVTSSTADVPNNAGLDMVLKDGSANITCTDNSQGALTCASGLEQIGIEVHIPRAGKVKACFHAGTQTDNGGEIWAKIGKYENLSSTIIELSDRVAANQNSSTSANYSQINVCGIFDIPNVGVHTFKLYTEGTDIATASIHMNRDANRNDREGNWTIEMVSHNVSRPIIQNMVDTSVGSGIRTEACKADNTGTPAINADSGLCESWIDSVALAGTGGIAYTFTAGTFSSTPICVCTPDNTTLGYMCTIASVSSSAVTGQVNDHLGNKVNRQINMSCKGKR